MGEEQDIEKLSHPYIVGYPGILVLYCIHVYDDDHYFRYQAQQILYLFSLAAGFPQVNLSLAGELVDDYAAAGSMESDEFAVAADESGSLDAEMIVSDAEGLEDLDLYGYHSPGSR